MHKLVLRYVLDFMFCKILWVCFKLCGYSEYPEQWLHVFVILQIAAF